jgi:centromeric protein E
MKLFMICSIPHKRICVFLITKLSIFLIKNRVHVSQLKEEVVTSAQHVMRLVAKGESNRSSFPTENNEASSRSHTIFQMTIESRLNTPNSSINVAQLVM